MISRFRSFLTKTLLCPRFSDIRPARFGALHSVMGIGALFIVGTLMVLADGRGGAKGNPALKIVDNNAGSAGGRNASSLSQKALGSYAKLPLSFERNHGQTDADVKFISRAPGYTLFLTGNEAVFSLRQGKLISRGSSSNTENRRSSQDDIDALLNGTEATQVSNSVLRVQLLNAKPHAPVTGLNQLPGKTNYFHGSDPSRWATNVATFAKVRYENVLDGVDLVYYGNQGQLEYDFVVSPGIDAGKINLKFNGARGLRVDDATGDLVMNAGNQEVRFHQPVAYQSDAQNESVADSKHLVAARYVLDARNRVSFVLGQYDRSKALVIDPTLSYSTYLGGASDDFATAIAVDSGGNVYVTGYTNSVNFPTTTGSFQTACNGNCSTAADAFVSKIDPTGSFLIYSTYLGGSSNDYANGIALDAAGNAYIAGQTLSTNFPTTPGAFQTQCGGANCPGGDAFVTELNPQGSALVYSTYLGGMGADQANAIALDASNNAYITGFTQSTDFPISPNAFQKTCTCSKNSDVYVTELNAAGSAIVYSTYLGGSNIEVAYAIALDSSNDAYITGYTHSTNFPTTAGAFQTSLGAPTAAFVSKINTDGSSLLYSTYVGGVTTSTTPCQTCATAIAVDSAGNAYITGLTAESNFPVTAGAFQTTFKSSTKGHDAFITKLNATGTGIVSSSFLGGTGDDGGTGILIDPSGNIWLRGNTKSTDLPVTAGTFQAKSAGDFDAFVAELDPTESQLLYSTYLGGSGKEYGGATRMIAFDNQSPPGVYVAGYTLSTDFPVTAGALQSSNAGKNDVFVSKFAPSPNVGITSGLTFPAQNDGTTSPPQNITLTNTGNTNLVVTDVNIAGPNGGDFSQTSSCATVAPQATCQIAVTFTPSSSGTETATLSVTDNAPGSPHQASLTGIGIGSGPAAILSTNSLTFPLQLVGSKSKSQTVTLTNEGNATLTITQITSKGDFLQTNNCGTSLAVGASCTISVTFKPTAPNTRTGSVTITDNAVGSPQSVSLSGTGTVVSLTPSSLNFGTITVGQSSSPMVATLRNVSQAALKVQITLTGTSPLDFPETNTCGSSVAAGASCTITVTFQPAAKGLASATVSVTDAGGGSPQTVSLIGTGQ